MQSRYERDSYVLPNYIDTDLYFPLVDKKNNIPFTILLVGNPMLAFKGFEKALTGLVDLFTRGYAFRVHWICQVKPEISPVPFEVIYFEQPSQHKLAQIYREADILLSCSLYEGCPMPPLEAMASRVVVVATNSGGILQYAENEYNALIVPYGNQFALVNALIRVFTDNELREHLMTNGLLTAKRFNYQVGILHLEKVLLNIIELHTEKNNKQQLSKKIESLYLLKYNLLLLCYGSEYEYLALIMSDIKDKVTDQQIINELQTLAENEILLKKAELIKKMFGKTILSDELFELGNVCSFLKQDLEALTYYQLCLFQTDNEIMIKKLKRVFKECYGFEDDKIDLVISIKNNCHSLVERGLSLNE